MKENYNQNTSWNLFVLNSRKFNFNDLKKIMKVEEVPIGSGGGIYLIEEIHC